MRQMMGQQATDAENIANSAEAGAEELADVGVDAGAKVGSALSGVATTAGEALSGTVATTAGEAISGISDALDLTTAATAEIPVVGEIVGIIAGIGSVISAAFGAGDKKTAPTPVVNQVGGDFSNDSEHGGENMAAY